MGEGNSNQREIIFKTVADEAGRFYAVVVTVASSFLGGTVLFLEKIAPEPSTWSLAVLSLGWASLIGSIGCIAFTHRYNLQSGYLCLEDKWGEARQFDSKTRKLSTAATILLTLGMVLVAVFGLLNAPVAKGTPNAGQVQTTTTTTTTTTVTTTTSRPTTAPTP